MKAFVTRMKYADGQLPTTTPTAARKCFVGQAAARPTRRADEGAFEQEREHALHGEHLADDTTRTR